MYHRSGSGMGLDWWRLAGLECGDWWVSRWVAWWWHGGYVFYLFIMAGARGRGMLGVL